MNEEGQDELHKIEQEKLKTEQNRLQDSYKNKGFQKMSYKEYEALRNKKKKPREIPAHIKFILSTPLLIIFCFGLFLIPYTLYAVATGKETSKKNHSWDAVTGQIQETNEADKSKKK